MAQPKYRERYIPAQIQEKYPAPAPIAERPPQLPNLTARNPPNAMAEWLRGQQPPTKPHPPRPLGKAEEMGQEFAQSLYQPDISDFLGVMPMVGMAKAAKPFLGKGKPGKLTERLLRRADIRGKLDFLSDAEKTHWDDFLAKWSETTPLLPQEPVTHEMIRAAADQLPEGVVQRAVKGLQSDPLKHQAVFSEAMNRISELNGTILNLSKKLDTAIPDAEKYAIQNTIAALEKDATGYLDWIAKTGSSHGRFLQMHQMMAKRSLDDAYWINRAKRLAPGRHIDSDQYTDLARTLAEARAARDSGDTAKYMAMLEDLNKSMLRIARPSAPEIVSAIRQAGLLTGLKNAGRNLGGNTTVMALEEFAKIPASMADIVLSGFTGRRTVAGPDLRAVGRSLWDMGAKGFPEAKQIWKHGAKAQQLEKFDFPRELMTKHEWLNTYVNKVRRAQGAMDAPFRAYALRRSLEDQARVLAINEKRAGKLGAAAIGKRAAQLAKAPSEEMLANAAAHSEFAVFANKTMLGQGLKGFRNALAVPPSQLPDAAQKAWRATGRWGQGLFDMVLPFTSTPSAIVSRVMEYAVGAPVGLVRAAATKAVTKTFTPAQQKRISEMIGRGMVGPALMYAGWKLAESGHMTGMSPELPSDRGTMEAANRLPGAIKIGGRWHQVGALSPGGNLMVSGAHMYEEFTNPKKPFELGAAALSSGLRSVKEQPMLTGMEDITEAARSGKSFEKMGQRMIGSFVPTAVADVGRLLDPSRRETRAQGPMASAMERIPGVRTALPPRRDNFGRIQRNTPQAFINPGIGAPAIEDTDPVTRELVQNRVGLGDPRKNPWESDYEFRAREALTGSQIHIAMQGVIASEEYQKADRYGRHALLSRAITAKRGQINKALRIPDPRQRIAKLKEMMGQAGFQDFR